MNEVAVQAINLMAVALPTMFMVILLFIGVTTLLTKIFPYKEEAEANDND